MYNGRKEIEVQYKPENPALSEPWLSQILKIPDFWNNIKSTSDNLNGAFNHKLIHNQVIIMLHLKKPLINNLLYLKFSIFHIHTQREREKT